MARMQAWIRLHLWSCNGIVNYALFYSSTHTIIRRSDHSHPALLSGRLNYTPDVNWIAVMAVWRPRIRRDESMAVDFIQLLCMASLQTLQTKIAVYDDRYRALAERETRLYRYLVCGWSSWLCDISPIAATFSSVYVNFDFQLSTVGHSPWTYPPDISPGRFLSPKTGRYDVPSTLRKLACRTENHTADVSRISNVKPFRVTTEHSENAT